MPQISRPSKITLTIFLLSLLIGICSEFFDIAWGTGNRIGEMALSWAALSAVASLGAMIFFGFLVSIVWNNSRLQRTFIWLVGFREKTRRTKWALSLVFFLLPVYLLQFTLVGLVFPGFFFRLTLWSLQLVLLTWLLTSDEKAFEWRVLLISALFTGAIITVSASTLDVTNYPFSLGWSEGNRLWDYSIMFGRDRYDYPSDQVIPVFLDSGRQFVGGLPYLLPFLTIGMERLWVSLTIVLPYLLLGLVAFRFARPNRLEWLAGIFWCFLFLKQGPIHPPLILIAALVAFAWGNKFFVSIPLVIAATVMASISRFTWIVAPLGWFIILEILKDKLVYTGGGANQAKQHLRTVAMLTISVFALALLANLFFPDTFDELHPSNLLAMAQKQDLLWYRLLPNETYRLGILLGLLIATTPLTALLTRLIAEKKWAINSTQIFFLSLGLLGYLSIGLIVSAKIGGGGDLHNLDMFLILLFFIGALAWKNGGKEYILSDESHFATRIAALAMVVIPVFNPLVQIRSYDFATRASWLVTIRDAPNEKSLQMRPGDQAVEKALKTIQNEIHAANEKGEILFIDQRQLLTFGFVEQIPLVPDYDKKVLIEYALSEDRNYFQEFYTDLENQRFSLIVVQPLSISSQGAGYEFGEENNAWVKWAAKPLLCYYDIKKTLEDVNVQLLVPKTGAQNCEQALP